MMFPVYAFFACVVLAWGFNELELISWRRSKKDHWTERARKLFAARIARQLNLWMIPGFCTMLSRMIAPESHWIVVVTCSLCGTLLGNFPMDRATNPGLGFRFWIRIVASSWLLQLAGWFTLGAAVALMPSHWDWSVALVAITFLAVHISLQFGLNLRLMRGLRLLKPASARLQSLVNETCAKMGVQVRATWELLGAEANAVAFVTTKELAFTEKLLAVCNDEEVKVICAHELGHMTETRWTLLGRVLGTLVLFPWIFARPVYDQFGHGGFAMLGLVVVLIWLSKTRLARAMEQRADRIAQESVEEICFYARTLERLYFANQMPAVMPQSSLLTHPSLYDRMVAANLTPDYPRPEAPAQYHWTSMTMTVLCMLLAMILISSRR